MVEDEEKDTIVALATAPGRAALAVVRLSGPGTCAVLGRVFRRRGGRDVAVRRPALGVFLGRDGGVVDEGVALRFAAPRSYTGEDAAELTLHGSPAVVREVVAACVAAGARGARPGEFTLRALKAGKLDVAQAEAVRDLIEAATVEQARVAARQMAGEVGGLVGRFAERALDLQAELEAGLDFAEEEDVGEAPEALGAKCAALAGEIEAALAAGEAARRVREGARVVLLGPPNAGKSSLFNRLLGEDRVIVTEEPGTTRDVVEETIVVEGLPVTVVDAAGVGEAKGRAEAEGMRRAVAAARGADLVLDVFDARIGPADRWPGGLLVGTHVDLAGARREWDAVYVGNASGEGLAELRRTIAARLEAPGGAPLESVALATERHRDAARRAAERLRAAASASAGELAAFEVRGAVNALREILGEVRPDELLGRIFGRFCIGK